MRVKKPKTLGDLQKERVRIAARAGVEVLPGDDLGFVLVDRILKALGG